LWQMHDLREPGELDVVFGRGGAIEAAREAKADGRVRFIGLTGHHDPDVLLEAMRRFPFDNVLVSVNPADPRRLPFIPTVGAEARRRGMGVVGMKVLAAGMLVREVEPEQLIRYAATLADTVIIGCSTVEEVRHNLGVGRGLVPMSDPELRALEAHVAPRA